MRSLLTRLALLCALSTPVGAVPAEPGEGQVIGEMLLLLLGSPAGREQAAVFVRDKWRPGFTPMLLEVLALNRDPAFAARLVQLLESGTGQSLGYDLDRWYQWLWNREQQAHPDYAEFKSALYGLIDERFEAYFGSGYPARIRLDEVRWGGVKQDGIPPLRRPEMIAAERADYLADSDVVFGLAVNGDRRAYPQRILGWHEMFVDRVGGEHVVGVYCTLCGTMILYRSEVDGVLHELGTSGFLYRSNKLMYDRATSSLWSTIRGEPVIGPLADSGIRLPRGSVVTSTWGEWRRRHPDTLVLSLATGYPRDYREGAAYREYFASDELMFTVPRVDRRLDNKAEVLGLVFAAYPEQPLAIDARFLQRQRIYQDSVGELDFVVFTDESGANRVYRSEGLVFTDWDGDVWVRDSSGTRWQLDEAALREEGGDRVLHRLPAQRAFWFGWFSAYNHTQLVVE